MTLLKIAQIGHPVLLARAAPVADPGAPDVRKLASDMIETLHDAGGIGLAAPQVHESRRLIVVLPVASRDEPRDLVPPLVVVNPSFAPLSDEQDLGLEGCLSIPSLRGIVPRALHIEWRGQDLDGRPIQGLAHGLTARLFQHEIDHLDGVLFPMRMADLALLATVDQVHHLMNEAERRRAEA